MKKLGDHECWTMSSINYLKEATKNVEERLSKHGKQLCQKAVTPMESNYIPETDDTPELDVEQIEFYQELIGILRWATEIGRVDILTEVAILSAYQASPREGHLRQLLHIFAYLKRNPKLSLYFDPQLPNIPDNVFNVETESFKEHYRDAKDELPYNMPKPLGRSVTITAYVDASHASNKVTRRSQTGFVIFVNRAPISWYSKRQSTVETSTFSSEFIAMKTCIESIESLRFKLRMFGVPIDGPAKVLCDNEGVVRNSSEFASKLNKKHSSLAYHKTRWCVAAGIVLIGWVDTNDNLADAFTKRLSADKRDFLFGEWTY